MNNKVLVRILAIVHMCIVAWPLGMIIILLFVAIPPRDYPLTILLMLPFIAVLVFGIWTLRFKNWARNCLSITAGVIGFISLGLVFLMNTILERLLFFVAAAFYWYLFYNLERAKVKELFS